MARAPACPSPPWRASRASRSCCWSCPCPVPCRAQARPALCCPLTRRTRCDAPWRPPRTPGCCPRCSKPWPGSGGPTTWTSKTGARGPPPTRAPPPSSSCWWHAASSKARPRGSSRQRPRPSSAATARPNCAPRPRACPWTAAPAGSSRPRPSPRTHLPPACTTTRWLASSTGHLSLPRAAPRRQASAPTGIVRPHGRAWQCARARCRLRRSRVSRPCSAASCRVWRQRRPHPRDTQTV
uniref:Putative translation initiation factor if-2-like protein n=1 Tax=Ixodes ricinus TaxID=34613 RepID=A0A147BPA6_IXORI